MSGVLLDEFQSSGLSLASTLPQVDTVEINQNCITCVFHLYPFLRCLAECIYFRIIRLLKFEWYTKLKNKKKNITYETDSVGKLKYRSAQQDTRPKKMIIVNESRCCYKTETSIN